MSKSKSAHSPPPGNPRAFDTIRVPGGRKFDICSSPGTRAFDTMKETSQHLVYPNNMHQYQSAGTAV